MILFLNRSFFSFLLISFIVINSPAKAQVDVTGAWTGYSVVDSEISYSTFSLVQNGNKITGSALDGNADGVITGTILDDQITLHSEYKSLGYTSDATATTNGQIMYGTFSNSRGISGTFFATFTIPVFIPNIIIPDPPVVQVQGTNVKLTLLDFASIDLGSRRWLKSSKSKPTIQYDITVKGPEKQSLTTKRNTVTLHQLPPGTYHVNYKASAIMNNKTIFSSKKSPTAVFMIK